MRKQSIIVSSKGKAELSSSERALLKGAFDALLMHFVFLLNVWKKP